MPPSDGTTKEDYSRHSGDNLKAEFGQMEMGSGQFRERESEPRGGGR